MSSSEAPDGLVEQVREVTACSMDEAKYYLSACANDVSAAVALFFEQGASTSTASGSSAAAAAESLPVLDDEDEVRAPIAPVREQLILPEDDNFFASGSSSRLSRVTQRVKVHPLRDFAREGALMEEQLQATGVYADTNRIRRGRAAQMVVAGQAMALNRRSTTDTATSTSRLGDLFRPPTDILYSGSLTAAREFATKRQRWLLVNVQDENFQSQTLNRDVWSDKELKKLIRRQFTFWQVDNDTSEGRRFVAFYHCATLPYICVIDPRTGEEVWRSAEQKLENVLPDLRQFLKEHRDFIQEDAPGTSKRSATYIDDDEVPDPEASCSSSASSKEMPKKRAKVLELTEEEQLELAIKNSINENGGGDGEDNHKTDSPDGASDNESLEEFDDEELKGVAAASFENHLGEAKTELTALKLRLLNAAGTDEMVQLRWPSDTKLQTLRLYISQTHKHIHQDGYKLICAFPRKFLEAEHNDSSLKELGLHPSANLHLTNADDQ
ncbi:UBX domain-containing protein 7 [Drosophila sechellia]|uniref:UBX domain-containing protein 7 n=1 Tax=Drosophila sechellia TaxID=7238 RepID=B4I1A4_DROSE|nr:UBX domain-containing protein 7 [Drosophila sechellia]EDW54311.1 GM18050 [Drosophila sechellia]